MLEEAVPPCVLKASQGEPASIALDFRVELQGYVELSTPITDNHTPAPVRNPVWRIGLGDDVRSGARRGAVDGPHLEFRTAPSFYRLVQSEHDR